MNTELLFQLYAIHSPSGNEKKMRKFLKKYITKNCGECTIVQDAFGNLLVTKGVSETYPCLASHIDQVQRNHSKDFYCCVVGDHVLGYSQKSMAQQGLGADDKNGIFVCLECLRKYDVMKCAFFVGEEVGCVGSSKVDLAFFKDCRYIVEPDRMNGHDLITSMGVGDVCSGGFIVALGAEQYGYKEAVGSITDVGELVERGVGISCLNLSCGYYHAHTDHEITVLPELQNCLYFVQHIVETLTDVYPFEYKGWNRSYYGGYGFGNHKGYLDDPYWDDSDWVDEYEYGGYRDEDLGIMRDYLDAAPNISLSEIQSLYSCDFYASFYFYSDELNDVISQLYDEVMSEKSEESAESEQTEGKGLFSELAKDLGLKKKVS